MNGFSTGDGTWGGIKSHMVPMDDDVISLNSDRVIQTFCPMKL